MNPGVSDVTVVAVCRGDGPVLEAAIERVQGALASATRPWRFVFVDDGTQDGTFARLLEAARGEPRIGVLRQERPRGFGAAIRAGLARSAPKVLCATEVDEAFAIERLDDLVGDIEAGSDVSTSVGRSAEDAAGGSGTAGWAFAVRADRLDLRRGGRIAAAARVAVGEIAARARRAGLSVRGTHAVAPAADRPSIGLALRKLGIAVMSRGRRDGAPQRAA
ncbi:MAG: glycosyltransferase family 2 protein [Alphaproteobacteria bacterium]